MQNNDWLSKDGEIYSESTGKTVAVIPYYDHDDKEQNEAAQLMADAPKILEALIECGKRLAFAKKRDPKQAGIYHVPGLNNLIYEVTNGQEVII